MQLGEAPVVLRTGAEFVYEELRDSIFSGTLKPGERLTEAILCERFGLSTTPVREALQRLVYRGLAVRRAAHGVRVRRLTNEEIRDIYQLRCLLEPAALRDSVPNLSDARLETIHGLVTKAESALARGDYLVLSAENDLFHNAILSGSPNKLMLEWIANLGEQRRLIAMSEWAAPERPARELQEHRDILARIEARDAGGAASLLLRHITASAGPHLFRARAYDASEW